MLERRSQSLCSGLSNYPIVYSHVLTHPKQRPNLIHVQLQLFEYFQWKRPICHHLLESLKFLPYIRYEFKQKNGQIEDRRASLCLLYLLGSALWSPWKQHL